ncbi:UDP-N-ACETYLMURAMOYL-L-ALANYL-D-GLUTAMATE-2 6-DIAMINOPIMELATE LIGASE [Salix purpurea]|uniref:UDP-N-ACETYLMURAMOYL-L-ALANYL-D-GLUTAMATE-2 6-DIAMINOPIMELATE LIGASE n=1 Tax=Salix purpurea TaxID=77065 RepID=A0A9Q0V1W2_SALPP|nr:UDP-N-ACETYLMURAMOYL-L-ALANYL-D-GLUTAMATE-2 6-DIAMINOPIMELATE LIGASE [Salix purpurea]
MWWKLKLKQKQGKSLWALEGCFQVILFNCLQLGRKKYFCPILMMRRLKRSGFGKKKKCRSLGNETVILKDMAPPQCIQNSLEFLKKKKMQLSRSSSVLNNPGQALRLISSSGLFSKK